MTDTRTFIKVHDGIADHPKVDPLSDGAFRLLITSWCWCSKHETDGKMPLKTWQKRGTPKARKELAEAGLVLEHRSEVEFHDYLEHQQSAEQRRAGRAQRRAAGQAGGLARAKRAAKQKASGPLSGTPSETQAEVEVEVEVEKETPSVSARDLAFEEFWLVYPRKVGKGHARKAWDRAIKQASAEDLIRGAVRLARQNLEERFTPHASTWLNGERWLDAEPISAQGNPHTAWAREQG